MFLANHAKLSLGRPTCKTLLASRRARVTRVSRGKTPRYESNLGHTVDRASALRLSGAIAKHLSSSCKQDSLAEWSKALASGASPQGRGFEPTAVISCSSEWTVGCRLQTGSHSSLSHEKRSGHAKIHKNDSGVAQWLACWAHNPKVRGSKPRSAIFCYVSESRWA